jgi:hypothetical protein
MSKEEEQIEQQIFKDADVDPNAPINTQIDDEIYAISKKNANAEALHKILLKTKKIHKEATGKGGRRSKRSKRSKKSKKRKSKRKKM